MKWTLSFLFYLASLVWAFYIGRFEVIYGAGASVIIYLQAIGLAAMLIYFAITKRFEQSLFSTLTLLTALHLLLIISHEISNYQPTYTLRIPDNYQGSLYLFGTIESPDDLGTPVDGIGYLPHPGKYTIEIEQGGDDISSAWQTSNSNEIVLYEDDSTVMIAYDVACIDINLERDYPVDYSRTYVPCMDPDEFKALVAAGTVDERRLRKSVYTRKNKSSPWQYSPERSRRSPD
ncbi:MAG: hypothetical protein RLP15_12360 [Cryomorphaceae bacterium]